MSNVNQEHDEMNKINIWKRFEFNFNLFKNVIVDILNRIMLVSSIYYTSDYSFPKFLL